MENNIMKKAISVLLIAVFAFNVSFSAFAMNSYDVSIEEFSDASVSYVFGVMAGQCRYKQDVYSTTNGSVTLSIWTNEKCFTEAAADEQAGYLSNQSSETCSWYITAWSTPQPPQSNASDESALLGFIEGLDAWNPSSYPLSTNVPVGNSDKSAYCTEWLYNGNGDKSLLLCFHETGIGKYLKNNNSGITFTCEKSGVTYAVWMDNGQELYWP